MPTYYANDIKETFLSSNKKGTFTFVILYKDGVTKTTVKKFSKTKRYRGCSDYPTGARLVVPKKMTCNYFSNYENHVIGVSNYDKHFFFVLLNKKGGGLHMTFTIKK